MSLLLERLTNKDGSDAGLKVILSAECLHRMGLYQRLQSGEEVKLTIRFGEQACSLFEHSPAISSEYGSVLRLRTDDRAEVVFLCGQFLKGDVSLPG